VLDGWLAGSSLLRDAAHKLVQRDLRLLKRTGTTEEPAPLCIARHARMSPCASAESARQIGFEQDRNAAGQADLPAVRMSAQHQRETSVRGLPADFRSV
jgi:hypothetical protein